MPQQPLAEQVQHDSGNVSQSAQPPRSKQNISHYVPNTMNLETPQKTKKQKQP